MTVSKGQRGKYGKAGRKGHRGKDYEEMIARPES